MKQTLLALACLALAFSIIACSAPMAAAPTSAPAARGIAPVPGQPPSAEALDQSKSTNAPNAASADRMIVYTVSLRLEVQDTEKALDSITAIVSQNKGYVAATNLSRDSKGRMRGTVTVRVPAESLDGAQKQIEATGLKVLSRNKNSNDVTDQFTDLGARLKNLEATEVELTKLLATVRERTGKAEDILAVYKQLTEIRSQIEQIKGQMNVLAKTSAMATMTVELVPHEDVQIVEPETWLPNKTAAEALRALFQALQGIINLAIWLLLFLLPVLIVLLLPFIVIALIVRAIFRRGRKKPATTT